ncbi:MAG: hypothetical protein PHP85_12540 [Gallionella sp.]|nr:hypothetical protein [Gallionella sp.]
MAAADNTIDHVTLSRLVEANAVNGANIIGQPGGWGVVIKYGMTERTLAAKRGTVRIFRKFETLVAYLKEIGVAKYQVDATNFDPAALKLTRNNEGAGARMKAAHEAAAYDKWFRAQVQEALDDTSPAIPDAEVKEYFAAKREKLEQRIKANAP